MAMVAPSSSSSSAAAAADEDLRLPAQRPPSPPLCALHGCQRSIATSLSSSGSPHLTCGEFHHFLLMASRFNPSSPPPHASILERNSRGLCGLASCPKSPYLLPSNDSGGRRAGHFCCKTHYLTWLSDFCRHSICARQICKLQGCPRHVFVEAVEVEEVEEEEDDDDDEELEEEEEEESDDGGDNRRSRGEEPWIQIRRKVHEFCGWRHRQMYAMLQAYASSSEQQLPTTAEASV